MNEILEATIKYLKEYLEIIKKEDKEKNILFSGRVGNLTQLINFYENELKKVLK